MERYQQKRKYSLRIFKANSIKGKIGSASITKPRIEATIVEEIEDQQHAPQQNHVNYQQNDQASQQNYQDWNQYNQQHQGYSDQGTYSYWDGNNYVNYVSYYLVSTSFKIYFTVLIYLAIGRMSYFFNIYPKCQL